jgi:hypothetical protein
MFTIELLRFLNSWKPEISLNNTEFWNYSTPLPIWLYVQWPALVYLNAYAELTQCYTSSCRTQNTPRLRYKDQSTNIVYSSGSQSGRYRPLGGGGITEVGANRYERWKGALLLSQGGASRQVVHLFL